MKEKFEDRKLHGAIRIKLDDQKGYWEGDKAEIVKHIIDIANAYYQDDYVLTLRQLYYQLVARDIVPNHDKVYSKISSIKDDIVYSGKLDWNVFEDRGRVPKMAYYEDDIKGALEMTVNAYKLDRKTGQKNYIEVWTEKDAISSILKKATDPFTLLLVINKGYTSSTAIYTAYERILQAVTEMKPVKILYFGDHDPSGIDMIRDIKERILFMLTNGSQLYTLMGSVIEEWWDNNEYTLYDLAGMEGYEELPDLFHSDIDSKKLMDLFDAGKRLLWLKEHDLFEVVPVGLTMEQIREYNPPHNPAKITDPRAKSYIRRFGQVSWEVDALKPDVMLSIVRKAIQEYTDMEVYSEIIEKERAEKAVINEMIKKVSDD